MLLWMTVVAGLAASFVRKVCIVVGVMVESAAMVGRPDVRMPFTWLLPWTVACRAGVLKAFSTFCSYVMPMFVWVPGWVAIPRRKVEPVGAARLLASARIQSRPSIVWFPTVWM